MLAPSDLVLSYWRRRAEVEGAFWEIDFLAFDLLLSDQATRGVSGDLLEIGALYGKSAIVLGNQARPDETVHICDIFETNAVEGANRKENEESYAGLNRAEFESNYAKFVGTSPVIHQVLSDNLGSLVSPHSLRFAHVDGGHLFETVRSDIDTCKGLLGQGGLLVIDDFRAPHTPGVAAATWAAVDKDGLIPILLTEQKFYGTFDIGAATAGAKAVDGWLAGLASPPNNGTQFIHGRPVRVVGNLGPMTNRQRVAQFIPPVLKQRLSGGVPAHLGT